MTACVYIIKHPITKRVVYVGQTRNFKNRKTMHITSKTTKSPIGCFMTILRESGLVAIFEIVLECDEKDRFDKEIEIIEFYKQKGHCLLNYHSNLLWGRQNYQKAEKLYLKTDITSHKLNQAS